MNAVDTRAHVGDYVEPDGWRGLGGNLQSGSDYSDSSFAGCAFYLPTRHDSMQIASNIRITGRTLQKRKGAYWVRVEIEFVGDGEPSEFTGGWMLQDNWGSIKFK